MTKNDKVIGILGGMGPQASAKLYELIIEKNIKFSSSELDEDYHPEILLSSVPVPNFVNSQENFEEAKNMLRDRTKKLEQAGATVLGIACNTAHLFLPDLEEVTDIPFISIIASVRDACLEKGFKKVGLFGSPITLKSKLYDEALGEFELIKPDEETLKSIEGFILKQLNNAISEKDRTDFSTLALNFIKENKLDVLILGCTELPLIFRKETKASVIDTLDLLAEKLLEFYYK